MSWLKNATILLSTSPPTEPMPVVIVTRSKGNLKPIQTGNNALPEENDAVIVDAEITELVQTTSTLASGTFKHLKFLN